MIYHQNIRIKYGGLLTAIVLSLLMASPVLADEVTATTTATRVRDTLYYSSSQSMVTLGLATTSNNVLNGDLGLSVPAKKDDYVEVTFCGSIKANAAIQIYCSSANTANATSLFSPSLNCGGSSSPVPIEATWKTYTIKYIYKIRSDGTYTFNERFIVDENTSIPNNTSNNWYVYLLGRAAFARILPSAPAST